MLSHQTQYLYTFCFAGELLFCLKFSNSRQCNARYRSQSGVTARHEFIRIFRQHVAWLYVNHISKENCCGNL